MLQILINNGNQLLQYLYLVTFIAAIPILIDGVKMTLSFTGSGLQNKYDLLFKISAVFTMTGLVLIEAYTIFLALNFSG